MSKTPRIGSSQYENAEDRRQWCAFLLCFSADVAFYAQEAVTSALLEYGIQVATCIGLDGNAIEALGRAILLQHFHNDASPSC